MTSIEVSVAQGCAKWPGESVWEHRAAIVGVQAVHMDLHA
jgi:hypothetical protein